MIGRATTEKTRKTDESALILVRLRINIRVIFSAHVATKLHLFDFLVYLIKNFSFLEISLALGTFFLVCLKPLVNAFSAIVALTPFAKFRSPHDV